MPAGPGRKTVDKSMRVLHAFSHDRPDLSIGDLARELGMHKSVVSRLVAELVRWRMLEQDGQTRRVRIGVGAFRIGALYAHRQAIVRALTPWLGELVARTGHSAHAVVLDGTRGLVVATVESPRTLRVIMRVGEHRPLHATAAGKLYLALSDPGLLAAARRDPGLLRHTPDTITDLRSLANALARVRREGVAWNLGEHTAGAGGVAAPVLDETGRIAAAISSVFPLNLVPPSARAALAATTRTIARRASEPPRPAASALRAGSAATGRSGRGTHKH